MLQQTCRQPALASAVSFTLITLSLPAGTTYTCLFILVSASLSGIKPGLATKPPTSPQVRGFTCNPVVPSSSHHDRNHVTVL